MLVGAAITIGHWCRTITALGDGGLEWVVITCDRLEKIKGHTWDVIIADEAHALRPTATKGWKVWATVSGQARPHDTAPFVISTTATPGHTPLELPYLAPAYAQVLGEPMREWTSATHPGARFASALERHGVGAGPDLRDAGRAHAAKRNAYEAEWGSSARRWTSRDAVAAWRRVERRCCASGRRLA